MTNLSPQAQAVWDTFDQDAQEIEAVAAALRAAADQVVPEIVNAVGDEHDEARLEQWMRIRRKFLAIAAELEGAE